MRKRKSYSDEFKACAVARVLEEGEKPTAVARDLGISIGQLKTWRLEQSYSQIWCMGFDRHAAF